MKGNNEQKKGRSPENTKNNVNNEFRKALLQPDIFLSTTLSKLLPNSNFFLFNREMRFLLVKMSHVKTEGLDYTRFENKKLEDIPVTELKELWEPLFRSALQGKHASREYVFRNQHFEMNTGPIDQENKNASLGVAIITNVSNLKDYEHDLKNAKEEAEQANRAKSEFLAHISHEIRTPLNSIKGFTEQLLKTRLDGKQSHFLNIIDQSAEHLSTLINDVLVLSIIEAKQIRFDEIPFKVKYTVNYVYETLRKRAEEKHLRVLIDVDDNLDMVLLGDELRLRQILLNLMNNAVKFTAAGYIELKCFIKSKEKDTVNVRFDISDTGIGISRNKMDEIFEDFSQADRSVTKKYGGTGLGLTISKNLIELQKGTLSVTSQEGIGSTFSFVLPFKRGSESDLIASEPEQVNAKKLRGKNVLLVDDDKSNRLLGEIILDQFECNFDTATSGEEAIQKLDQRKYDVVLMDIHMPDVSGFDVTAHLRKKELNKKTRVIAVTAVAMKEDIDRFFKEGIDDYLVKPFRESELYNKMCEVLHIEDASGEKHKVEIILKDVAKPSLYNLGELRNMAGNNKDFVDSILRTFIENAENTNYLLSKFLKQKEWEQIGEAVHKIIPSFRHLEVHGIVEKLEKIHKLTKKTRDYEPVPKLVERTRKEITELLILLNKEIG